MKEPKHIQYLPVRSDVLVIIETQVAENDEKLVEFSLEVALPFKNNRTFYMTLPSHSSKGEFQDNTANQLKIRLPQPR